MFTCAAESGGWWAWSCFWWATAVTFLYLSRTDGCSPLQVDMAGIDILLVGDSVGMVVHGHDTTLPVTLEDILVHCKAVFRGTRRCGARFAVQHAGCLQCSMQGACSAVIRLPAVQHAGLLSLTS